MAGQMTLLREDSWTLPAPVGFLSCLYLQLIRTLYISDERLWTAGAFELVTARVHLGVVQQSPTESEGLRALLAFVRFFTQLLSNTPGRITTFAERQWMQLILDRCFACLNFVIAKVFHSR